MSNLMKIFGLEIRLGNTQIDLKKVDDLLLKTTRSIRQAKTDWIAYSEALNSLKGHELILQFMKEFEAKTKTTTIARRVMTAEEKVAAREAREAAKAAEMQVLAEKSRVGSIRQLEAEVARLNIAWKSLSREERKNTAEGRAMTAQLANVRKELRETKMAAGDFSGNVGNYISALYNGVTSKLALLSGVIMGIKRILTSTFGPFQDFEYRMAMVKAVSGATAEEFEMLKNNARELGATTEYTATEVAGLQLAYARMGFVPEQIRQITGATLDLATATGEDLAKSADVVGTTLKGFNLTANQTQRVVDVMAKSFNASSLQLDSFYDAMKYVAPLAVQANVSIEETTAMLGVLADRGIRGSQAGTSLRRIFTEIAKEGGSVAERLDELSKKGITLGGAMDEVGRYAMTALTVLANSKDSVDELSESLYRAEGAAKAAADGIRDTMKGDVDVFLSAVKEKLIGIGEIFAPLARDTIQFGTWLVTNLKEVALALVTGIGLVKAYNTVVTLKITLAKLAAIADRASAMATTLSTASLTGNTTALLRNAISMRSATLLTKALAIAKLLLARNTKAAGVAMRAFTGSLASNPIGLVAVALASLISYLVFFRKETDQAADAQQRFNDENDRFNKVQDEKRQRIDQLIRTIQDETETEYAKIQAYEELQRLSPTLTDQYTQEQIATLKLAESNRILNEERDNNNYDTQKAKLDRLVEVYNQLANAHGNWNRARITDEERNRYNGQTTQQALYDVQRDIDIYRNAINEIEQIRLQAAENLKPIKVRIVEAEANEAEIKKQLETAFKAYENARSAWIAEHGSDLTMPLDLKWDVWKWEKQLADAKKKTEELKKGKNNPTPDPNDKGEWSLSKDKTYNAQLLALKQQLHSGQITSEEQYQRQVLQLEIDTLQKRIALNKDDAEAMQKLRSDLLDKQNQQRKAVQKEEQTYAANRKAQTDRELKYENDRIDAEIAAMADGVAKKIALNDQATKKAKESAAKEHKADIDRLTKEQDGYAEGSEKYQAIEAEKASLAERYAQKTTDIVDAGAGARVKILRDATDEELTEWGKLPDAAADAERLITENKRREVAKRLEVQRATTNEAVKTAEATYRADVAATNATETSARKRNAANLQSEIALRNTKAQSYMAELRQIEAAGQADSDRYRELLVLLGQVQTEATNLGKGKTAGGKSKSIWTQFTEMSDEQINQIKQQAIDLAGQIGNALIDAQKQASQRRLNNEKKALEAQYKVEAKLLDSKRDKGLISEKQYQKELEKLEAEKAKKEEEAERAAFEREKKLNIKQVLMNTAISIAKTFADWGWPLGIPFAALAAASGAVQIATIASQKYAQGGLIPVGDKMGVVKGRSHAQGGHQIYLDGRPIGEIEGDELIAIVNKRDTARIGALSAINSVNGRKFAQGGLIAPAGYMTSSVSAPVGFGAINTHQQAELAKAQEAVRKQREETTQLLLDNIEAINRRIDTLKVVVVEHDVTEAQNNVKKIKVRSSW